MPWVGPIPAVIVTHEETFDPVQLAELGAARNEYVTRMSDYDGLPRLIDYLLPGLPTGSNSGRRSDALQTPTESIHSPLLPASAPVPHLHPDAVHAALDMNPVEGIDRIAMGESL
jgi:hypothetical protein